MALLMTVLIAVSASILLVDLLAWQWLPGRGLPLGARWLLVAALLLTAAALWLLSRLGRTGRQTAYVFSTGGCAETGTNGLPGLGSHDFFEGDEDNSTLRRLHLAAAWSLIAWLGSGVAGDIGREWAAVTDGVSLVVLGLVGVVVLALGDPERTVTVGAVGPVRRWWHGDPGSHGWSGRIAWILLVSACASLAASCTGVVTVPADELAERVGSAGGLPRMDGTAAWTGLAGAILVPVLLLAVAVLARLTHRRQTTVEPFRPFARGNAAGLVSAVALFVALGLTSGLALTVQGLLNRLTEGGRSQVAAPATLESISWAWGVTALIVLVLGVAAAGWLATRHGMFRARVRQDMTFGDPATVRLPEAWVGRVARAVQIARLKNHVELVVGSFGVAGTVFGVAAGWSYAQDQRWVPDWPVPSTVADLLASGSSPEGGGAWDDVWVAVGQWTLVALASGAVLLARGAIRAEGARRGLNVVWDVISFWPRSVHPFVPPPYSQEVVPALVRRICWHLGLPDPLVADGTVEGTTTTDPVPAPGLGGGLAANGNADAVRTVVLAAHSQGSLVSLAALLWLPAEARSRVRWLTFGSQLRVMFPRAFPHYVTTDLLERAQQEHAWLNLYRDTDPIGGPVTSWCHRRNDAGEPTSIRLGGDGTPQVDEVDERTGRRCCGQEWRLLDPVPDDPQLQRRAVAEVRGHSDYWKDPDWPDALAAVLAAQPGGGRGMSTRPRPAASRCPQRSTATVQ